MKSFSSQKYTGKQPLGKPFRGPSGRMFIVDEQTHHVHPWSPEESLRGNPLVKPSPFSGAPSRRTAKKPGNVPADPNSKKNTRKRERERYRKTPASDLDRFEVEVMDSEDPKALHALADMYEEQGDQETADKVRDRYYEKSDAMSLLSQFPEIGEWDQKDLLDPKTKEIMEKRTKLSTREFNRGWNWILENMNRDDTEAHSVIDQFRRGTHFGLLSDYNDSLPTKVVKPLENLVNSLVGQELDSAITIGQKIVEMVDSIETGEHADDIERYEEDIPNPEGWNYNQLVIRDQLANLQNLINE